MNENVKADDTARAEAHTSVCIDWYSEGETRVVEVDGMRVVVRFVGRKGRRGRIVIEAPAGAVFSSCSAVAESAGSASGAELYRSLGPKCVLDELSTPAADG
jgi:hypothetical protein